MAYFTKKEQLVIIFLIILILAIALFGFINKSTRPSPSELKDVDELLKELADNEEGEEFNENIEAKDIGKDDIIMIHISGQVYKPGLIELKAGSRVIDAVELAGGLKAEADLDRINLAKKLEDEEKIYISKIGEEALPLEVVGSSPVGHTVGGKININNCSKEELMTLPGIGEVLAGRIIDYREANPFKSIEDIRNVSGIGEKRFEEIKDLIIIR